MELPNRFAPNVPPSPLNQYQSEYAIKETTDNAPKETNDGSHVNKSKGKYNKKIEKTMKEKQLEQNQILSDHFDSTNLQNKIKHLEMCNNCLQDQKLLLCKEISQINFEKSKLENEFINLKTERNELRLQLSVKNRCVTELKQKIQQQQLELQHSSENNANLVHLFESVSNELHCVKKSENWYKNEFSQFQIDKSDFNKSKLENEKNLLIQQKTIERLKLEMINLKRIFREIQQAQEKKMADLEKQSSELQIELNLRNEEKERLENSVKTITEHFKLFKMNYRCLKNESNQMKEQHQNDKHELCDDMEKNAQILKDKNDAARKRNDKHSIQNVATLQFSRENMENDKPSDLCKKNNLKPGFDTVQLYPNTYNLDSKYIKLKNMDILNLLLFICKWCNLRTDINHNNISSELYTLKANCFQFNSMVTFLCKVMNRQCVNQNIAMKKGIMKLPGQNISRRVMGRIKRLEIRCHLLQERHKENVDTLKKVEELNFQNTKLSENVKNLQALLQVKDREAREKHLQYERKYRTLLRKVAEQIRVRKEVEKQTNNSNKLQLNLKESEINNIKEQLKHNKNSATLKNEIVKEPPSQEGQETRSSICENEVSLTEDYHCKIEEKQSQNLTVENSNLQETAEEIKEVLLQYKNQKWDSRLGKQLESFKSEINSLNKERFFLQRLCNDLRTTLNVHINQNKALKKFISDKWKSGRENIQFNVTNFVTNFPTPKKYDASFVEKLLKENKTSADKSRSHNQEYFNILNKEIGVLQQRIIKKYILSNVGM